MQQEKENAREFRYFGDIMFFADQHELRFSGFYTEKIRPRANQFVLDDRNRIAVCFYGFRQYLVLFRGIGFEGWLGLALLRRSRSIQLLGGQRAAKQGKRENENRCSPQIELQCSSWRIWRDYSAAPSR